MLQSCSFTIILISLFFPSTSMMIIDENNSINETLNWAEVTATRLVVCYYNETSGIWLNELAWQSGNTLESLANFLSHLDSPLKYVFNNTFIKTGMFIGGDCFDDYQWWLLGWLQAYSIDQNRNYLHRAADIYDIIVDKAWNTTQCSGGIQWCPTNGYKNAITNELFLSCSMRLHPYATILGKSSTYYLNWALKEWEWFENSGIINNDYLINDGLNSNDNICVNNNQTTWTYNQGVILSGLALLYNATNNKTLLNIAQNIADATIQKLIYSNGILKEPCEPNCDNDQKLFKGIFVRHLSYLLPYLIDPIHIQRYTLFIQQNVISVSMTNRCELDGLFGLFWNNTSINNCDSTRDTATTSSVLDLFLSIVNTQQQITTSNWILLGMGNCMDDQNFSMANFYKNDVTENICRKTADDDIGAIAYDYELKCNGNGFCRIRTLSDRSLTPTGWTYEVGNAITVTRTNKIILTNCYLRTN